MRRVVITGVGLVTPLGVGAAHVWAGLLGGKSGAKRITEFDVSDIACQIGCLIPRGSAPASSIPTSGWNRRSSARSTISSSMRVGGGSGDRRFRLERQNRG